MPEVEFEISPVSMVMYRDPDQRWTARVIHAKHGIISRLQISSGESFLQFQDRVVIKCAQVMALCEHHRQN